MSLPQEEVPQTPAPDDPLVPTPPPPPLRRSEDRLGMSFHERLFLGVATSYFIGFSLGAYHEGHQASLRFRAENAHRLPISQPGWYLYHKSKNYYKMKEGTFAGLRSGARVAAWTSIFLIIEESMDIFRGTWRAGRTLKEMEGIDELDIKDMDRGIKYNRNFFSSIVAGMVTAGIWSAWNTFPMVTASRTITTGLAMGLTFGLGQDALRWVRMNKGVEMPKEESWLYRNARNKYKQVEEEASMEQK